MKFTNPVIRGYYPDPSICRAGDKYYLVSSSFHYFPGVPLFESTDLINWKGIGYCLTRYSQLPLTGAHTSGGIFAPTIRYNDGTFYMVTTNVTGGGNFYVYTDDIYGEWSEPVFVKQDGIDPSLYFEGDKAYFMSNGSDENGKGAVFQCEIDIKTGEKLSESKLLWYGSGGRYLESPHLYKINGLYYLTAAEGGTEYGHMVTYARSENISGPYVSFPENPVLTNRNLGGYEVQGVGHADLIEDKYGNWWLFHLGFRQIDKWLPFHHLGRETFMMPVDFSGDGWFRVKSDIKGATTKTVETERLPEGTVQEIKTLYTFENTDWHIDWQYIRNYDKEDFILGENSVKIKSGPDNLDKPGSPSLICLHQKEFNMELSVNAVLSSGEAGVTVYMDENHHYDILLAEENGETWVILKLKVGNIKHTENKIKINTNSAKLIIKSNPYSYEFLFLDSESGKEINLGFAQTRYVSSETALGFTGVILGLFSQNGDEFNEFSRFKCEYFI